jgi:hypothetical protein
MIHTDCTGIRSSVNQHEGLEGQGYGILRCEDLSLFPELQLRLQQFVVAAADLPTDPDFKAGNRLRRYGRFRLSPWKPSLDAYKPRWDRDLGDFVHPYSQETFNSDYPNSVRQFPALTPGQQANPFLEQLILFDFAQIPWKDNDALEMTFFVGVHLLRHIAKPGLPGVPSPDFLHQDGEPFTFAHLIERHTVTGGINTIASADYADCQRADVPPDEVRAEFTLLDLLDTYVVANAIVSHYVSPIHVIPGHEQGCRTILLIDFIPLLARKTLKTS